MGCPKGETGQRGYCLSREESLLCMARLSLFGKLNLVVGKCKLYPVMIPNYGKEDLEPEDLARRIDLQSFAIPYESPWERVLSIVLKKHSVTDNFE